MFKLDCTDQYFIISGFYILLWQKIVEIFIPIKVYIILL